MTSKVRVLLPPPRFALTRFASYGSASHPAIINGKDSRKADAALAFN
jgi:hypothetical protein